MGGGGGALKNSNIFNIFYKKQMDKKTCGHICRAFLNMTCMGYIL